MDDPNYEAGARAVALVAERGLGTSLMVAIAEYDAAIERGCSAEVKHCAAVIYILTLGALKTPIGQRAGNIMPAAALSAH